MSGDLGYFFHGFPRTSLLAALSSSLKYRITLFSQCIHYLSSINDCIPPYFFLPSNSSYAYSHSSSHSVTEISSAIINLLHLAHSIHSHPHSHLPTSTLSRSLLILLLHFRHPHLRFILYPHLSYY